MRAFAESDGSPRCFSELFSRISRLFVLENSADSSNGGILVIRVVGTPSSATGPQPDEFTMSKIRKAVITAAGEHHSQLPLQTVVGGDGLVRTALQMTLEQIRDSGIDEVALVICPGMRDSFVAAAGSAFTDLTIIEQHEPRGYGDAILRAEEFLARESFLHLVSDHLYLTASNRPCARQLIDVAEQHNCCASAVQSTRENEIGNFGTISGMPVARETNLYELTGIIEKPTPTIAEQQLVVAGQRAGHYLCFFGMHVLTPSVLDQLRRSRDESDDSGFNLTDALNALCQSERCLASILDGTRCNIGQKYGLLLTQLAISLGGQDRDYVLGEMIALLAAKTA